MASRKCGLSNEEIQRMLFDDNDSVDDISELDSDDNLSSSSSIDNNNVYSPENTGRATRQRQIYTQRIKNTKNIYATKEHICY